MYTYNPEGGKATTMLFEEAEKPFEEQFAPIPVLEEEQVLVEISYATICTSDLHTFYGRRQGPVPTILGHEIIGAVLALGSPIHDFDGEPVNIGDRITWSVYAHDHNGEMAQKGLPQKSADLFKYGHQKVTEGDSLSGGFATHCILRKGTDIYKLPSHISERVAAPLNCTHATVAGALRLAGEIRNKNILVVGAGMLGLSACAMSREKDAASVTVLDVNEERLKKASLFGADHCFLADNPMLESEIGSIDIVIETSGVPVAMESAMNFMNTGGICVWVGAVFQQQDVHINAEKVVRKLLTIKGLHNYIPQDLKTAIEFISVHGEKYPFEELVCREFPLEQLTHAFAVAADSSNYRIAIRPDQA